MLQHIAAKSFEMLKVVVLHATVDQCNQHLVSLEVRKSLVGTYIGVFRGQCAVGMEPTQVVDKRLSSLGAGSMPTFPACPFENAQSNLPMGPIVRLRFVIPSLGPHREKVGEIDGENSTIGN